MTTSRIAALCGCLFVAAIAGTSARAEDLPAVCGVGAHATMPMPMATPMAGDAAHKALMGAMQSMSGMGAAMQAEDIDVAFVCGMIPHHQGAIDMAEAELEHGDDPWVREMAQKVIDAQTAEIAAMREWLAGQ
jgi:uncharacterized protein (DUF305 family)